MENKLADKIQDELMDQLKDHFKGKITSSFTINQQTDTPYTMFSFSFVMYDYYHVVLNYDRGRFGCSIINGTKYLPLKNSQKWYDKADMDIFLTELQQQIELRIPDKFLEFNGWK